MSRIIEQIILISVVYELGNTYVSLVAQEMIQIRYTWTSLMLMHWTSINISESALDFNHFSLNKTYTFIALYLSYSLNKDFS